MPIGWMEDGSEREIRRALAAALPDVELTRLAIRSRHVDSNPLYWQSSAVVNDELVAKFAWSEVRATRLHREGVVIERLPAAAPRLRIPELVALHDDPVVVVTRRVAGAPLEWGHERTAEAARVGRVADELADFMVGLHGVVPGTVLDGLPAVVPTAQSDTTLLRSQYGALVDDDRARRVIAWCGWIDAVLDQTVEPVLVHGDLHGDNQIWDVAESRLVAVVDFEECGVADPHFDFRCIPGLLGSCDLAIATADAYERRSGRLLSRSRVMAWHALTVLGDALWRTRVGIGLPGGGDACSYVDDVESAFHQMGVVT